MEPAADEASQPASPPSSPRQPAGPVCYSVEAVLGPQWSRPLPRLFPAPGQKEFQPLYLAEPLPANPHAGDAASAATEDPVFGGRASPEPRLEEVRLPPPSPASVHETVPCWIGPQENRLEGVLHPGLESKCCGSLPLTSVKLSGNQQPSPQASGEAAFADRQCSVNSAADGGPGSGPDPGSLHLKVGEPSERQRPFEPSEDQRSAEEPAACSAELRGAFRGLFATPLSEPPWTQPRPAGRSGPADGAPSAFLSLFAAPLGAPPWTLEAGRSRAEPAGQPASQQHSRSPCGESRGAEEAGPDVAAGAGSEHGTAIVASGARV